MLLLLALACGSKEEAVNPDVEAIVMNAPARAERPGYRFQLIVPRGAPESDMKPETMLPPILAVLDKALIACPVPVGTRVQGLLQLEGLGTAKLRATGEDPAPCFNKTVREERAEGMPEVALDLPWLLEITGPAGQP